MTNAEILAKVETAITALLTGNTQAYSVAGRSLTRLPLTQLYQMRKELTLAVSREQNGIFRVAQFRNPE